MPGERPVDGGCSVATCPALAPVAVSGDASGVVTRNGELLVAVLGTMLPRIEGGEHSTPGDHPDVVAAAIKQLLPSAHPRPVEEQA